MCCVLETLTYNDLNQQRYLLNLHKMNFVLAVRNYNDSRQSPEANFLPEFIKQKTRDIKQSDNEVKNTDNVNNVIDS